VHNEELRNFYSSPNGNQIEDEVGGACSTRGKDEKCIQNFSRKT
jgi:hypothetical protein